MADLSQSEDGQDVDCRSEEGIIVGLIDGIIAQSRVVAQHLRSTVATRAVLEALADIRSDDDVARVLRPPRSAR